MSNEWQPIETAPKDGTWVLLYAITYDEPKACAGFFGGAETHERGWYDSEAASLDLELKGFTPTHWAPLPVLPIKKAPAGEDRGQWGEETTTKNEPSV